VLRRRWFAAWVLVVSLMVVGCVEAPWAVDLAGPRVVRASIAGPRAIEVPVLATIEVELSEALDPASVHAGSVALVEWEEVGSCERTPVCEEGSCERGRCMVDPLSAGDLRAIDRGAHEATIDLEFAVEGPFLRIRPRAPLRPRARHSLVLGAGLRDRQGAPLSDEEDLQARWRVDLVTAEEGSSGPQARLAGPISGEAVPTNLEEVVTTFARPVAIERLSGATLALEGEDGGTIELASPTACAGWVPGFCLRWALPGALMPSTRYRLGGGALVDRRGAAAVVPGMGEWFVTGEGEDRAPPSLAGVWGEIRGPCLNVGDAGEEARRLQVGLSEGTGDSAAAAGEGALEVALRLPAGLGEGAVVEVMVEIRDRAGNAAAVGVARTVSEAPASPVPLGIAEVLANPAGPEPAQEFVEIVDLRGEGPPVEVSGLWLADRPWAEVRARLAEGAAVGDAVPAFTTSPGQRTVIVGAGYAFGDPRDPDPPASATVVRLGTSIGEGGLRSAGEPLSLFRAEPPGLVASFSPSVDTADAGGQSVVGVDPGACDHPGAWRLHPFASSSPGWAP